MIRSQYRLLVATTPTRAETRVTAVLGRDIRSKPEKIARYCVAEHRGILEDVATVSESIALADRLFPRHRSIGWSRRIEIEVPVYEYSIFQRPSVQLSLIDAIHFLTGDIWEFCFTARSGSPDGQGILPFERIECKHVIPYSDGLDSFALRKTLVKEYGDSAVLKVRSGLVAGDTKELRKTVLKVPRYLGSMKKPEKTYRSRPFVFFTYAGIGAFVSGAESVLIAESGQGALGPALIRYADEWPFRSTHPGFTERLSKFISIVLGINLPFALPNLWRTKGEVLRLLAEDNLLEGWESTQSCSVRPNDRHRAKACGICGGCLLRQVALVTAEIRSNAPDIAFDIASKEKEAVAADGLTMSRPEREMLARSLGSLAELSRLADSLEGQWLIKSESTYINEMDRNIVVSGISNLVQRHKSEWLNFVGKVPDAGWAGAFARQL